MRGVSGPTVGGISLRLWMFSLGVGLVSGGEPTPSMDLVMPGAKPSRNDDYLCSSFDVSNFTGGDTVYVTGFTPHALANKAHHMLLYTCDVPKEMPGVVYDCLHHSLCNSQSGIMFAWAKNAPATTMPQGVSFSVDPGVKRYLVLQVHYKHPLDSPDHTGLSLTYQKSPTKYRAGIFLLLVGGLTIPPNTAVTHGDVNCALPSPVPLHMFAYRTHAHGLSTVITGYVYNEQGHKYRQIAAGSPQWPQAFYPMNKLNVVNPGEIVTARCTYNSTGVDHNTYIGSSAGDEMCNLYIMYFTEASQSPGDYLGCVNEQAGHDITRGLPKDSDKVPDKRPDYEAKALDASVDAGPNVMTYAKMFEEELSQGTSKKKVLEQPSGTVVQATLNFTMPGVTTTEDDDYVCTGLGVGDISQGKAIWAVSFAPVGQEGPGIKAHHMILSKCKDPKKLGAGQTWGCRHHAMCNDQAKIMFAWAKHAPSTQLPQNVGFSLDEDDYLVLQVHYAKPQVLDTSGLAVTVRQEAPIYTAGIFLMLRSHLYIPPQTEMVHGDINCPAQIRSPIHIFAYRTHAHSLGKVISGYRYSPGDDEEKWSLIAKGNPMWPQAFYPMQQEMVVNPGDILAARCTYDTVGHATATKIGATGGDEMCNLYLMFYTLSKKDDFLVCADEQNPSLTNQLPRGSDTPLPPRPDLEHKALGQGESMHGVVYTNGRGQSNSIYHPHNKKSGPIRKRPGVDNKVEAARAQNGEGGPSPAQPPLPPMLPQAGSPGAPQGSPIIPHLGMSNSVLTAAAISVPLTLLIALCLAVRRCKKRGKGSGGGLGEKRTKDWNVGDILGRSKEGFKPLNTEERDGMLDDDSDSEVEEFSIPANHA